MVACARVEFSRHSGIRKEANRTSSIVNILIYSQTLQLFSSYIKLTNDYVDMACFLTKQSEPPENMV
jgi:hypothetical protein